MDILFQVAAISMLALPAGIAVLTELMKILPIFPTTSKNAKLSAFVLSLLIVGSKAYTTKVFEPLVFAGEVVLVYTSSIGFYEACKGLINKLK